MDGQRGTPARWSSCQDHRQQEAGWELRAAEKMVKGGEGMGGGFINAMALSWLVLPVFTLAGLLWMIFK
jgi:hypothetical protein